MATGSIGIFDSGVGGLSVLRHVHAALPTERLVYCADAAFAPYGDKPEALIVARALAIAGYLVGSGAKALVVACNTATAAAIAAIRQRHPQLAVVGVEPGLKPAAALSTGKVVGVLATTATLASTRFALLKAQVEAASGARFVLQACPGLADQIEKGELRSAATARLVERFVRPLLDQGVDTLVLGCTHYPFVTPLIAATCASHVLTASSMHGPLPAFQIIDTGEAVARQLAAVLRDSSLLCADDASAPTAGLSALTTGSASSLAQAFLRLLTIEIPVAAIVIETLPAPA